MIYYDNEKNNSSLEGEIVKNVKSRGFSFSDDNGSGFIYLIDNDNDDDEYEYEIQGECKCCIECMNDENCHDEYVCVNNICVECENDEQCDGDGEDDDMKCNKGKCIIGECGDNDDCKDNEICNDNGECVKGCRNDDDCNQNIICNQNGNCVEGCRFDENCEKGKYCLNNKCSEGCRNNFDCGKYDDVCVDNNCVTVTDETISCLNDDDCDYNYYCDYEYMICIINRKGTSIRKRRKTEILPLVNVCTVYGLISLFVMASSYSIVSKFAEKKLTDECYNKCSGVYYSVFDIAVSKIKVSDSKRIVAKYSSECTGYCKKNGRNIVVEDVIRFAEQNCHKYSHTSLITADKKNEYLLYHSNGQSFSYTYNLFVEILSVYCKNIKYRFWFKYGPYPYPSPKEQLIERMPCVMDKSTIKCRRI